MATTVDPSAKREADALLTALIMAERHKYWAMFEQIAKFIQAADGKLSRLGSGSYAIEIPPPTPKEPQA